MNRSEVVTSDGSITESVDEVDDDKVTVTLGSGDTVRHATGAGLGGVTYEILDNAVLLVRRQKGNEVVRAYSSHGWVSVTGPPREASVRKAGY